MNNADRNVDPLEGVRFGAIHLNAKDLPTMQAFYQQMVGLEVLSESKSKVELGYGGRAIIVLHSTPSLPPAAKHEAGLYHSAILFSSRADLARTLKRILLTSLHSYGGSGDHLVSEAFYFLDPEGNGLELYYDRPRDTWKWQDGQVQMDVRYIDAAAYIHRYADVNEPSSRQLGHVHLKVGSIEQAEHFYTKLLGMAVTARVSGAVFVSAGGYHHHFGLNMWHSEEAKARMPGIGLGYIEVGVYTNDYSKLIQRLQTHNIDFSQHDDSIDLADPWNNALKISVK